ncbi:MAG: DUF4276 family protein [Zoogloeaceae bacterium]|jgi:hypothetical protein|nr:DUF4276 family protein [Zoogloeaceae bacterium]
MSKKITIIVEGATEKVFMPTLRAYLGKRLPGKMPRLDPFPYDGPISQRKGAKLRDDVKRLLCGKDRSDAVIALSDVYPEFSDAEDAKNKMRAWVGDEARFSPHVALYEFEAWLLPFWKTIQDLAGSERCVPGSHPEHVNHGRPPSRHLQEVFLAGRKGKAYSKTRDAKRILDGQDLAVAAKACPELQKFLDAIVCLCED